jgi:hypothetical protein
MEEEEGEEGKSKDGMKETLHMRQERNVDDEDVDKCLTVEFLRLNRT